MAPAEPRGPDLPEGGATAREIAEVLWLAVLMARAGGGPAVHPTPPGPARGERSGAPNRPGDRPQQDPPAPDPPAPQAGPEPARAGPAAPEPQLRVAALGRCHPVAIPAFGVRAPGVPALPQSAGLSKALRPLRRRADSPTERLLDEEATAGRAADTGLWDPVLLPAPERWLDLELVVDTGDSMVLWHSAVTELRRALHRAGAFRSVNVSWLWHTARGAVGVRDDPPPWSGEPAPASGSPRRSTRRAVIVFTDGVSGGWRSGAAHRLLSGWARSSPTACVQPLERRLWPRTFLQPVPVTLRAPRPGCPNSALRQSYPTATPDGRAPLPVPVVEFLPEAVRAWADLVARPESGAFEGFTVHPPTPTTRRRPNIPPPRSPGDTRTPLDRVLAFRANASPQAFELAGYLSAAPLFLPVMRLVQKVMAPRTGSSHLAEVFLSGLLCRRPGAERLPAEQAEFDFGDEIRPLLLGSLHHQDSMRVLRAVSDYLGRHGSAPYRFDAVLTAPADRLPAFRLSPASLPFARVDAAVAQALGGRFAERAEQLRRAMGRVRIDDGAWLDEDARVNHPGSNATIEPMPPSPPADAVTEQGSRVDGPALTPTDGSRVPPTTALPGIFGERVPEVWGRRIPPRNPNFTGREDLIAQLRARLEDRLAAIVPQAFFGMGGVGKTQLAVEYTYRYRSQYDLVWWVDAEQPALVRSSLAALAPYLRLEVGNNVDDALPAVLEALRRGTPFRRWLLVFDNADQPHDIRRYFPPGNGHILVTSRNQSWASDAQSISVDVFSRDESIDLLRRRVPGLGRQDADRLAEALGDLPLAVEQAGAWQAETAMSVDEYLGLLRDRTTQLLESTVPPGYRHSVVATWKLSMERLAERSTAAVQLLHLCSCMAPEPISWSLLRSAAFVPLPSPLAEALRDPVELGRDTREIGRLALARIDHRSNSLQMHRLVQAVILSQISPEEQTEIHHLTHILLAAADPQAPGDSDARQRYEELRPHILPTRAIECEQNDVRRLVINMTRHLYEEGDWLGGVELAELARREWRQRLGDDHPQTLQVSRALATLTRSLGRYDEARAINAEILERSRRVLGEDHEETLRIANSTGGDLRTSGAFEAAAERDGDTLARLVRTLGEDHGVTLNSAANQAINLRVLGRFQEALELDLDTFRRRSSAYGSDEPATLLVAAEYARDQRELGLYRESCESLRAIYARLAARQGEEHPNSLTVAKNLAVALRAAGHYDEALELSERTLAHYRNAFGRHGLMTLGAMGNFAVDLCLAGDLDQATDLAYQAYQGYLRLFGVDHPYTPMTATNYAIVLRASGQGEQARRLNAEAREQLTARFGADHHCTLRVAVNLAGDYHHAGQLEKAARTDEETLGQLRTTLGENHPVTLVCAGNLAQDWQGLGRADEAARLRADVVERFGRTLGPDYPVVALLARGERAFCDIETPVF